MPNAELIQIIIQGGAVGLLLVFGVLAYKIAGRMIDVGLTLLTNHVDHLVEEFVRLREAVESHNDKLDVLIAGRIDDARIRRDD